MAISKDKLDEYIKCYTEGHPLISDEEYDRILEEYLDEHGQAARPFLRQKQSDAINDIVGSLDKTFGVIIPMIENRPTYKEWIEKRHMNLNDLICIQPKYDGCSVAYDAMLHQFFTRGDYDNGESVNVTHVFAREIDVNDSEISSIKFEAIMSHQVYDSLNLSSKYLRPRDAVSAAITSRIIGNHIHLAPLREYRNGKQYIPQNLEVKSRILGINDYGAIQLFIDELLNNNAIITDNGEQFECDGVVVSIVKHDEYGYYVSDDEVAIKILNLTMESKLLRIEFQFGKTGRITPVAIVEPVKFGNITVDHITVSNIDRLMSLGLKYGDTVEIMYNIVPYLKGTRHDGTLPIQPPEKCPICGSPFDLSTVSVVKCKNVNCPGLQLGSIIRHCQIMLMMGISEGILTKLFDEGIIKRIPDIYELTVDKIKDIEGFGEKSAQNIINSIKHASQNVPIQRFLGSFPMDDVSVKTWKTVIDNCNNINTFKRMDPAVIIWILENQKLPGIGDVTKMKMIDGITRNIPLISLCLPYISFNNNNIQGCKGAVAMSGTRDQSLSAALTKSGYIVNEFTNDTKYLIIPDKNFVSAKVNKAKNKNIPILTIKEAYDTLIE